MPSRFCHHCGQTYTEAKCPCKGQTGARGSTRRWRNLRAAVLERDDNACQRCRRTKDLEVHHMDGNAHNDRPTNLLTLCEDCHHDLEKELAA